MAMTENIWHDDNAKQTGDALQVRGRLKLSMGKLRERLLTFAQLTFTCSHLCRQ